jgi:hypothetical protein
MRTSAYHYLKNQLILNRSVSFLSWSASRDEQQKHKSITGKLRLNLLLKRQAAANLYLFYELQTSIYVIKTALKTPNDDSFLKWVKSTTAGLTDIRRPTLHVFFFKKHSTQKKRSDDVNFKSSKQSSAAAASLRQDNQRNDFQKQQQTTFLSVFSNSNMSLSVNRRKYIKSTK